MKRVFLAMLCGAALIASSVAYAGDAVSDKEMADRYSQAALSGDSDAQFYLGALYSSGVGRPRSDEEAFRWFSRAADQGHSHAMLVLSGIYQPSPQLSPAVSKQPPATTSNNSTVTGSLPGPRNTSEKKNDMDALLDRVPTGLRKRFGF